MIPVGAWTKADLITLICAKARISQSQAETLVNAVFDAMVDGLMNNERIEIRGFGIFVNRQYNAYVVRNPKTGVVINVPPKKLPRFKVGRDLLKKVNLERGRT